MEKSSKSHKINEYKGKSGVFYIENSIDEWHRTVSGYFPTEAEAREGLKKCYDWFRPNGTGKIYFKPYGVNQNAELVYESI